MSKDEDELDLVDTALNPLAHPDKRFMLLAGITLPVLLDRAGGAMNFSATELEAVNERYGGRVAVRLQKQPDGTMRAWLVPSKKKANAAQA